MATRIKRLCFPLVPLLALALLTDSAFAQKLSGAVYTTTKDGMFVNQNVYVAGTDVYLNGGPQNARSSGLPDGTYFFQVTNPSGKTLLSTDNAVCRQLTVTGGRVSGATGPCPHPEGAFNPANGSTTVQLAPFSKTPNAGSEYKVWLVPTEKASVGTDPKVLVFSDANAKTDNFKTREAAVPQGSCQPSSSLSALVNGTNVVSYIPKGAWSSAATNVAVVNVEGSTAGLPATIVTPNAVNSCASNSVTGQTVCTANNTDVYLISGTTLGSTLTSAGSGAISFSGGSCTNCGVAMDAVHNKAVIALSLSGTGGYQFLNLSGAPAFEPAFPSPAPSLFGANVSEDILIDPFLNLILSPNEANNFEIVNVASTTSPSFFENTVTGLSGELDSAGEDCSTGIALAPAEFSLPSQVYIADLTQAVYTPGAPGTWSDTGAQVQTLSESFLSAGASGIAVAQGTHTGIVSGEFGGDAITSIALPTTSGSGTPAISDWVTCNIGNGFSNGLDPHTVTAYQSPNGGHAIALLASLGATTLAVVDLTMMLDPTIVPRSVGGHGCATSPLPASVVRFIPVP